eukprot:TRINITY_DN40647_c0_g1_i1.p1 TRINITY_DN40647_c0_g1~~TRINITY_DN40647_c0_g1_i1.p1  ORF type:complete len:154 (+),score=39.32 TRINITY_DN40647_c0_g1_i1:51-464(+)
MAAAVAAASQASAYDGGPRPVVLNNPHGWSNVKRFATLTMTKLVTLERKLAQSRASALARALAKVQRRHLRESLAGLRRNSSVDTFLRARAHTESVMQRLHTLVESFDLEVDHMVDDIVQSALEEDEGASAAVCARG